MNAEDRKEAKVLLSMLKELQKERKIFRGEYAGKSYLTPIAEQTVHELARRISHSRRINGTMTTEEFREFITMVPDFLERYERNLGKLEKEETS